MSDNKQGLRPCAMAFAVTMALGLSGCGGGGSSNVRPSPPPSPPATGTGDFVGGNVDVDSGDTLVWSNDIGGAIDLIKGGAGKLVLTGSDSYTDGTTINDGTLQIGNGGTTGSITGGVVDNAFLVFDRSDDVTFGGIVSGSGSVGQAGKGTLTLTGTNTYTGGTAINDGKLQLGNGGTTGSIVGDVKDNGSLVFNRADDVTFNGIVSGSGSLRQAGNGALILTGRNTYTGGTTISNGMLQVGKGGTTGSIGGDLIDNGTLAFDRSDDMGFGGRVTGTGGLAKAGNGALTLTGANGYTGATLVNAGSLYVDGDQSGATGTTTVANGATLGGKGTVGGNVTEADGATLAPGSNGGIGALTIKGNLALSAGSTLDYSFGQASVAGGPLSDLVNVSGNLVLDGTLNVSVAPGGGFSPGVSRMFNYAGTLTDNGLTLGSAAPSSLLVQTSVAQQVNLVNTQGMVFSFWDGDAGPKRNNAVNGGNGTWESGNSLTLDNWTNASGAVNAPFSDRSFAVFQATPGTVAVDDSNGDVNAAGMQFASDGYVLQGDAIHLVGSTKDPTHSIIRVGDGTSSGAGFKATIHSVLDGTSALVKTNAGTLVLNGANTYTGGTTISGGTLQLGNGGTTGSITGDVTDNGSLVFDRSDDVILNGIVSGSGSLAQIGAGTLTLTGSNTYAGGTTVTGGVLEIAPGATLGTGSITVGDDNGSFSSKYTVQVDQGVALSNRIVLKGYGILDNTGALGGNVEIGAEGENSYFARSPTVLNHDGGSIEGNDAGIMLYGSPSTVKNSSGGTIQGGTIGVGLGYGGLVSNDGVGSVIRSSGGIAIQTLVESSTVQNKGGGVISGRATAIDLHYGGVANNDGAGSLIDSAEGIAVQISGEGGTVENTGGGVISAGSTAIYLEHGGRVTNGSGSTIETTGTVSGDCGAGSNCSIFVASDSQTPNSDGGLTLVNAGNIVGNVQMISTADNSVSLSAGSSIQGDLAIGSRHDSSLTFDGDAATSQLYSKAVTGTTTFAGDLAKTGDGTWIVDNNDLTPDSVMINGGTLQIGNGGTEGSIGQANVSIYHGKLVFNRSDDVLFEGSISGGNSGAYDSTLVQAGAGTLTLLPVNGISPNNIVIERGTLQVDNTGSMTGCLCYTYFGSNVVNDGSLVFNSNYTIDGGVISGTGSVTLNGSADVIFPGKNTYSGGTTINNGTLLSLEALPGNVLVNERGALDGYSGATLHSGVPGVAGNLSNAGKMFVRLSDSSVGGNYTQNSTGTLAVSLGSKLDVAGTATLNGGTLEVTGVDSGYASNSHTNVLTAAGGVNGTFGQLVKDSGVVFTATTINYDATSVWLDTTGLNVTTAAAGKGVSYTPASMGGAKRVQGAFEQLDSKIAAGDLSSVSGDFVQSAAQFQQSPTLKGAQASLQSLSGQLHAVSAAMTFKAIDASSRALSDRFDNLLDKGIGVGMWTQNLSIGGDMSRAGFDGVGFQLNGWLVGSDRQVGRSGIAGFAFGQSQGQQHLIQSFDHDNSRSTEGMLYAGWLKGNWYTQGRVGFGHFQQEVTRQILLGESTQGVGAQYSGSYSTAYDETGLHFGRGDSHVTPYVNVQYARIDRNAFAEQGAGGFGLRSNAQTLDRWQAGLGIRAGHHWELKGGRAMDFSARAQWQQTLAEHGEVFDASFVGLQQWQPLVGIGLSRYSGLFGVGLDATLLAHTALKFGYDYEMGQRDTAQTLSARLSVAF